MGKQDAGTNETSTGARLSIFERLASIQNLPTTNEDNAGEQIEGTTNSDLVIRDASSADLEQGIALDDSQEQGVKGMESATATRNAATNSDEQAKQRAKNQLVGTAGLGSGGTTATTGFKAISKGNAASAISDAEAKERARPTGAGTFTPSGAFAQDSCSTSLEKTEHGVQPFPQEITGTVESRAPSTGPAAGNAALLDAAMEGLLPMPTGLQRSERLPTRPGAQSVQQFGSHPMPVAPVRFSMFRRLNTRSQNAQLPTFVNFDDSKLASEDSKKLASEDNNHSKTLDKGVSGDLVVANVVNDSSLKLYPHAELVEVREEEEEGRQTWGERWIYCFVAGIVVIAVSVLLGTLLPYQKEEESYTSSAGSTTSPSVAPTLSLNETIWAMLPPYAQHRILTRPDSNQNRAYQWLLNDTNVASYPTWRVIQRFALATLFFDTNGDTAWMNNANWLSYEVNECLWYNKPVPVDSMGGFLHDDHSPEVMQEAVELDPCGKKWFHDEVANETDEDGGKYIHLRLFDNNLEGSVPLELYELASLKTLHLFGNHDLGGRLSTHIGKLEKLVIYDIGDGNIEGNLPTEIGLLTELKVFAVDENHLEGSIPSEFGLLQNLSALFLELNKLTSTIPTEIGRLMKARSMHLDANYLEGTIPTEIGALKALSELLLAVNKLKGTIPSQIGLLTSLEELDLVDNNLSGTLPHTLYSLENLRSLTLDKNSLIGSVTSDIGLLINLESLQLQSNLFSGRIPSEVGRLSRLTEVDVADNRFNGSLPTEIGLLSNLTHFEVDSNFLSGAIPSEVGQLLNVAHKDISSNNFVGEIPLELGILSTQGSLLYLNISGNPQLSGTIPAAICGMSNGPEGILGFFMDCTEDLCGCDCEC